jgi:hypothetical protein
VSAADDTARDWLLQWRAADRAEWQTFHVYSGDRARPSWPCQQAARLRRLGTLRTIRRENEGATT